MILNIMGQTLCNFVFPLWDFVKQHNKLFHNMSRLAGELHRKVKE